MMADKEQYLSGLQLGELRKLLLDKRRELLESLGLLRDEVDDENRMEGKGGGLSSVPTHPADMGASTRDREMSMELLTDQERQLQDVEDALARLEHGEYGYCVATGEKIGYERLKARPWAKYSLNYAKQIE
jgi:RNA polymerase-binding transcription factor DksA